MRLLLISGLIHFPHLAGANKGNRVLMQRLARRGHSCRVVCPATGVPTPATREDLRERLAAAGVASLHSTALHEQFRLEGVDVYAVPDRSQSRIKLRASVRSQIQEFQPDWVLVAGEDPGQALLREALREAPSRVIYLAQTTQMLPCGPACPAPDPAKTALLQQVAGAISISRYLAEYLREWASVDSLVLPYLAIADEPFPDLGRFEEGAVTLVNPCPVKGISILLELARRNPELSFAAVPTWGATAESLQSLAREPNIQIVAPRDDVDAIFSRTRILLVPSLWYEAFGAIALEAMLRGIPVIASDVGGLAEAKRGVDYLIPIRPIEHDPRTLEMIVPPQDLRRWNETLRCLLGDRDDYERVATESRRAARAWVKTLRIEDAEQYLLDLDARSSARDPVGEVAFAALEDGRR